MNWLNMEKILIVDDEREIGRLLKAILRSYGFDADHVADLKTAKNTFETGDYGLVFLDLDLPDGSGFSIVPALKRKNAEIPIVVISAHIGDEEEAQADQLGIANYIRKPFSKQQIKELLDEYA